MGIKRVTIEYDSATYIAEGDNARSWKAWVDEAEKMMKAARRPIWNNWSQIQESQVKEDPQTGFVDGPDEP